MGLVQEFKEFAVKGNAIDLAVGVVIGAAFTGIVNSLVKDVIMPPLGVLTGGVDFSDKAIVIKQAVVDASGAVTTPATTLSYGLFINACINFLIVSIAIFMLVKIINQARRKPDEAPAAPAAPPAPTREETLLMEIRDALRSR